MSDLRKKVHFLLSIIIIPVLKLSGETGWVSAAENIEQEFYLVRNLNNNTHYQFRVAGRNQLGWGEYSVSSAPVKTGLEGSFQQAKKYFQ